MLPITDFLPRIVSLLANANNLILQAEPGAGKSTALPLSLLDAKWLKGKKILMLEPRRVAAKSIAHYLARQLGEKVGQRVGYQIKNDRKISKDTVLEIVTEGILTRRLQSDPEISDIGLIIFDEFHERSIHADLSLLLSLEIQQTIRDDLKLLVMSATIDTDLISWYMGSAEVIECPGRAYPVSVEYIKRGQEPLSRQVTRVLSTLLAAGNTSSAGKSDGDILVFLPGQADIKRCMSESSALLGSDPHLVLLPLYGGLPLLKQEQALMPDPGGNRRIVFTTNIAETSLTIEGVTCVIDSGLEKALTYDPVSGMTRLETAYISKASATQRKGRAGRTQAGSCIRLWDEQKQRSLRDYQSEEILLADLTGFVLELFIWGYSEYQDINWLTPPPMPHFLSAKATLASLGLIDSQGKVTALGDKAAGIGVTPRLAAMLLKAEGGIEKGVACELAALLSDRDIFYSGKGVDIAERLLALQDYKVNRNAALKAHPINRASIEQLLMSVSSLKSSVQLDKSSSEYTLTQLHNSIGKLLLYAYPDRLAKRRSDNSGRYQLANGRGVFLFDDDPLFGSQWLVVVDCDAIKKEGRIYSAAAITLESVLDCLDESIVETAHYEYDSAKQKIIGRSITEYGALEIKRSSLSDIPSDKFQECLLDVLKSSELSILNWTARCHDWLARAEWLGRYADTFPKITKALLLETSDEWLLPYISGVKSISALKKVSLFELLLGILSWEEQKFLEREAPLVYQTPSNKTVTIIYDSDQGPTVSVPLQEMFGEVVSPKIAGGKVPIRFELLSPARRPIQTTSDLANFWRTSYFEVAKEMRGRYPKHRWPEQPLEEKPGKSLKRFS
ncbi:ATP-dependent helicase HrpB [Neptunomonas qingdaonensis]|uniref:ATP-dependent helicase HrpB n=1 Tax=Neptunomonas qingdaonensis TaxID=1045558 RepID=A0A1I2PCQ0_9GAMM|nr:ATP-dependent helicase HrpB [Neptunomonas qingdaonensis]SFG11446.1 ATP-dependent helicase HrpB [Neptunomonas qingdaonensis]